MITPVGNPVAAVQARVAEIEARFGLPLPTPSATSFDRVLASVRGRAGFSAGTTTLPLTLDGAAGSGEQAVALAQRYLGTPYVWGGESPGGFDCSGFIQYVYRQLGVELPRVSRDQARVGQPVASLAEARPGDLVAFNTPVDHVGIYAGDGLMVVAPKRGDVVKVQRIYAPPTAIRRVLPE